MHAHDRTLLARLGFGDADRKNPQHDLACQYLASKWADVVRAVAPGETEKVKRAVVLGKTDLDVSNRLIARVAEKQRREFLSSLERYLPKDDGGWYKEHESYVFEGDVGLLHSVVQFERPVEKGEGQYKTTIGFIDLVLHPMRRLLTVLPKGLKCEDTHEKELEPIAIEVKIGKTPIAECCRQITLYQSYANHFWPRWVLASPWQIDEEEKGMLQGIQHIVLGSDFEAFCKQPRKISQSPVI